ncbi:hypothetical protein F4819DRAFT_458452 [Hypoxylon fuscum]|nr:hypothetical protein F4819DRAFT_458452 [Hypoxylon fuscum]
MPLSVPKPVPKPEVPDIVPGGGSRPGSGQGETGEQGLRFGNDNTPEPDPADTNEPKKTGSSDDPGIPDFDDGSSGDTSTTMAMPAPTGEPTFYPESSESPYVTTTPTASATAQADAAKITNSSSTSAQPLPDWAIPLIIVAVLMGIAFLISLVVFCLRERRRKDESRLRGKRKDPSYARAVGRAFAATTGLFVPIWIIKKLRGHHRRREAEDEERNREYLAQIAAYVKLEEEGRRSEDSGGVRDFRDTREVSGLGAARAVSPASPLKRGASMVSSLSSTSMRSQGRYERLDRTPSPMTEGTPYTPYTPYTWRPQEPSETQARNTEDRGTRTGLTPGTGS